MGALTRSDAAISNRPILNNRDCRAPFIPRPWVLAMTNTE